MSTFWTIQLPQIFANAMTAQLSWHVQNIVAININCNNVKQNLHIFLNKDGNVSSEAASCLCVSLISPSCLSLSSQPTTVSLQGCLSNHPGLCLHSSMCFRSWHMKGKAHLKTFYITGHICGEATSRLTEFWCQASLWHTGSVLIIFRWLYCVKNVGHFFRVSVF